MSVPYDLFARAFLAKVREYDFVTMDAFDRNEMVDGYMKRAIAQFKHMCQYDLTSTADDIIREFVIDIDQEDLDELVDIV